jgi:hypothetical protein
MEHLPIERLTPFAARYIISECVQRLDKSEDVARDGVARKVLANIRTAVDAMPGKIGLSEHFDRLCDVVTTSQRQFGPEMSPSFDKALSRVVEGLKRHQCCKCGVRDKNKQCTHGMATFVNVDKHGCCIALVKRRFRHLNAWIAAMVRRLPELAQSNVEVTFATIGWDFYDDRRIAEKFSLGGYASSYPNQQGFATKISLAVRDSAFGWQQFCILPYVFLHEILCHAFQSLDNPPNRENAHAADAWSEGWMDRLAFELAIEWLVRFCHVLRLDPIALDDAKQHVRLLHDFRYRLTNLAPPSGDEIQRLPQNGRDGFVEALASYPKTYSKLNTSRHPLTLFSLRLNAITVDRSVRVGRVLEGVRFLRMHDPARLHRIVGAFIAEPGEKSALSCLLRDLP